MITIPEKGILLAPSSLHLPLYEQAARQKGDCLNLKIIPLETFVASLIPRTEDPEISLLYQYKNALRPLSETNAFYESREDLEFLRALLSFSRKKALWKLSRLPEETRKEKDLKEALDLVDPVWIREKDLAGLMEQDFDASDVWILEKEFSASQLQYVQWLLSRGARLLKNETGQTKTYWSAANTRKEMEAAAGRILDETDPLPLDSLLIALASPKDETVLEQILDSRHIPYSFLLARPENRVIDLFCVLLDWIRDPSRQNFVRFLSLSDRQGARVAQEYLELFPEGSHLSALEYEENPILDQNSFTTLRRLEQQYEKKCEEYAWIQELDTLDLEKTAEMVQKCIPHPKEEDIQAFDWALSVLSAVQNQLRSPEDLDLLIQYLNRFAPRHASRELKGVHIGSRQDISGVHEHVIFIGPHAGLFPGLHLETGFFDENYLARTDAPGLSGRLEAQRQNLFDALSQPENLLVLLPQSDYTGRSLDSSPDLDAWMQERPLFQSLPDPACTSKPKFQFAPGTCRKLFEKEDGFSISTHSMSVFSGCPLQHYLRYGLHIYPRKDPASIRVSGELLTGLVRQGYEKMNKEYLDLDYDDVLSLVRDAFSFAMKVFPDRKNQLEAAVREYAFKVHTLLEPMKLLSQKAHMQLSASSMKAQSCWTGKDGMKRSLTGTLNDDDFSSAAFTVYSQDLSRTEGAFALSLKDTSQPQSALKVSYRTKLPSVTESDEQSAREAFVTSRFYDGWKAQNLDPDTTPEDLKPVLKKPSFEAKEKAWQEMAETYISHLDTDQNEPIHQKNTCKFCAYRSICRNAAVEFEEQKGNSHA